MHRRIMLALFLASAPVALSSLSAQTATPTSADQQLRALYGAYAAWDARDTGTVENARGR